MKGQVHSGINNIYKVEGEDSNIYECRIKGKILNCEADSYNPLAPGDRIKFTSIDKNKGLITQRQKRINEFSRWNRKQNMNQTFAANLDLLFVVISASNPPPRPRFVDRVLINAAQGNVPTAILINKIDLGWEWDIADRISSWEKLGINSYQCSALHSSDFSMIRNICAGKTVAFFGSSGVGKTTLINKLVPGSNMPTRSISPKYNRGRHVTNFARLLKTSWGAKIIDTPGIREIMIHGISADRLVCFFDDLQGPAQKCFFPHCSHIHEKSCAVKIAIQEGQIHPDRYESYLRIHSEILRYEHHWA